MFCDLIPQCNAAQGWIHAANVTTPERVPGGLHRRGLPSLDKLDAYIQACDAVLHLVGEGLGSTAKPSSLADLRCT